MKIATFTFAFLALFGVARADDTFVLRDLETGRVEVDNAELAALAFSPYSTFKIPNTLVGLASGIIVDEHFTLKWDGKNREIEAWNRDQDLGSALRDSVVWYFQEVARRVGPQRMQAAIDRLDYGNRSTCCAIDRFWLDGTMRITPLEQAAFLARLARGETDDPARVALLRRLLTLESTPAFTLQGKTGTGPAGDRDLGWLVGWVTTPKGAWSYAYLVVTPRGKGPSRQGRRELVKARLAAHGIVGG